MTLRRPKKPGTRPNQEWTEGRREAFRAFRLRGLYGLVWVLSEPRRQAARDLIDAELVAMGLEAQSAREARQRAEWEGSLNTQEPDHVARHRTASLRVAPLRNSTQRPSEN